MRPTQPRMETGKRPTRPTGNPGEFRRMLPFWPQEAVASRASAERPAWRPPQLQLRAQSLPLQPGHCERQPAFLERTASVRLRPQIWQQRASQLLVLPQPGFRRQQRPWRLGLRPEYRLWIWAWRHHQPLRQELVQPPPERRHPPSSPQRQRVPPPEYRPWNQPWQPVPREQKRPGLQKQPPPRVLQALRQELRTRLQLGPSPFPLGPWREFPPS